MRAWILLFLALNIVAQSVLFDFYHLEYVWGPAWGLPTKWWIHGGWPGWKNGTWPEWCGCECWGHVGPGKTQCSTSSLCYPPYNESEIGPYILPYMKDHWALGDPMWEHEWKKHGTCQPLALQQYFDNILWFMLDNNWAPNVTNGETINTDQYLSSLPTRAGFGCYGTKVRSFFFCTDPWMTQYVDCPISDEMCFGNLTL